MDRLYASEGRDTYLGGDGIDVLLHDGTEPFVIDLSGQLRNGSTAATPYVDIEYFDGRGGGAVKVYGNDLANYILGGSGKDELHAGVNFTGDTLSGGAGNDTLFGSDATELGSGPIRDTVPDRNNFIDNGTEYYSPFIHDNLFDPSAGSAISISSALTDHLLGGAGNDVIYAGRHLESEIDGGSGNDTIFGGDVDSIVRGGDDDDLIYGGIGNDILAGESFPERVPVVLIDQPVTAAREGLETTKFYGADTIYGGAGDDRLYSSVGEFDNTGSLVNGYYEASLLGDGIKADGPSQLDGGLGDDKLYGAFGDDRLDGGDGRDVLFGGSGNDTLIAGNGGDVEYVDIAYRESDGGTGSIRADHRDILIGGAGDDWLKAKPGDYVFGDGQFNIEPLDGQVFESEDGSFSLDTNDGNDTLDFSDISQNARIALDGSDPRLGGAYRLLSIGSSYPYLLQTTSNLHTLADFYVGDQIVFRGNLALHEEDGGICDIENAIGGFGNDTIIGGSGANRLEGSGGSDSISGGRGDDTLLGGSENDTLQGGAGEDFIDGGAGLDTAAYKDAATSVTVNLSLGYAQVGLDPPPGQGSAERDTLISIENAVGSPFADRLTGDGGDNKLEGDGGDDVLAGGLGDDTLDGGTGSDGVTYADAAGPVIVNLATAVATGEGTDLLLSIEHVVGSKFADHITGGTVAELLDGGEGNDTLDGGLGNDTLLGGIGTDTLDYKAASVAVKVDLRDGYAEVGLTERDSISGVEVVVSGEFDDTLMGSGNADRLESGPGNDVLNGREGQDTMLGGAGNDTYYVNSSGDVVIDTSGTDTVVADLHLVEDHALTLAEGVEIVQLAPTALSSGETWRLTGNGLDNFIFLPSGLVAVIDGGSGNDTLSIDAPATDYDITTTPGGTTVLSAKMGGSEIRVTHVEHILFNGGQATTTGSVIDGYVSGATVWADADGDGILDPGEASTTTDGAGSFTLLNPVGPLVATGGTDISTGRPFTGTLTAPVGSTVVTPLTTLVQALELQGAADPAGAVKAALGLPANFDLLHTDPIAVGATAIQSAGEAVGAYLGTHPIADLVAAGSVQPTLATLAVPVSVPGGGGSGGGSGTGTPGVPGDGGTIGLPTGPGGGSTTADAHQNAVYRFFDKATGDHFYTADAHEADVIKTTLATFSFEGVKWSAPDAGAQTTDVFRFFDRGSGTHFLTSDAHERDVILQTLPTFTYEGVAFAAYTNPAASGGLTLQRFFNTITGEHHFAADASETYGIAHGAAGPGWQYEGAGFTVHMPTTDMLSV